MRKAFTVSILVCIMLLVSVALASATAPTVISTIPEDGEYLDITAVKFIMIQFSMSMDTESVLKGAYFNRKNVTDNLQEPAAVNLCTFLRWFGVKANWQTYQNYGCDFNSADDVGIVAGDDGNIDVAFSNAGGKANDTLTIIINNFKIGTPLLEIAESKKYLLEITIIGAKATADAGGETLSLARTKYYFSTVQPQAVDNSAEVDVTFDDTTISFDPGDLSGDGEVVVFEHTNPADSAPPSVEGSTSIAALDIELHGGVSLLNSIDVCVIIPASDIPADTAPESLRLYHQVDGNMELLEGTSTAIAGGDYRVCAAVTELSTFAVQGGYPYGDTAPGLGDGMINLLDAQRVIQHWLGSPNFTTFPAIYDGKDDYMAGKVGDVNDDGSINLADAQEIVQVWVELLDKFSVLSTPGLTMSHLPSITRTTFLSDPVGGRVSVILDDATDVSTAYFELTYDASLLTISDVSQTSLTSDSVMEHYDSNAGKLRLALVNGSSLRGAGSLMDVQFELMPGANSADAFDSIKLTKVELNSGLIKSVFGEIPQRLALLQNYPNPFNPETWIPYELNKASDVEIRIYNINGQIVRRLSLGQQPPGSYIAKDKAVYWDGANETGEKASSGVYFYQLRAGETSSLVKKLVIIK